MQSMTMRHSHAILADSHHRLIDRRWHRHRHIARLDLRMVERAIVKLTAER
jgi:hypothetical protein